MYLCLFNIYANPENPGINDLQSRDFWDQILVRDPEFRDPGIVFPTSNALIVAVQDSCSFRLVRANLKCDPIDAEF
jgi:hypothetical protein